MKICNGRQRTKDPWRIDGSTDFHAAGVACSLVAHRGRLVWRVTAIMLQWARLQLRPGLCGALWIAVQLATAPLHAEPTPAGLSSQQEYWAQIDRKDWDAAIASAQQLLAPLRPATPANALQLAEALLLLGNAQLGKRNLVAAESAFSEALTLTEERAGNSSSRLLDPLRGLGYTLAAGGKHAAAVPYLDRALLLLRRNSGLFDLSQQGLLRQLAVSQTLLGQLLEAERHMLYLLRVGEHAYGANDPRMSPVLCMVGDWYIQVGQMWRAREYYRTALTIVEKKLGRNDPAVVAPLRSLAESYVQEVHLSLLGIRTRSERLPGSLGSSADDAPAGPKLLSAEGEKALLRALKILEGNPDRATRPLQETLLQLGDWYLMKQLPAKAFPYYGRAATLDGTQDSQQAASASALGFPVQVYYPTPNLATRNRTLPAAESEERYVRVEFTVMPDGSVKDARIADADATDRQKSQTLEAIHSSRYRPKFADGKPVETTDMSYRQVFKQRKETTKETE